METTFAQRLALACDRCPQVPPKFGGRQEVIAEWIGVSAEAVSKWFAGESIPRQSRIKLLAKKLGVDEAWLALGVESGVNKQQARQEATGQEGAVHYVAGLIKMTGSNCVFPKTGEASSGADLYAIIDGEQVSISVSRVRAIEHDSFEVFIPNDYAQLTCVAVVPSEPGHPDEFHVVKVPTEVIDETKKPRDSYWFVNLRRTRSQCDYEVNGMACSKINFFGDANEWS